MARILLGVSGGIAVLQRRWSWRASPPGGPAVRVLMTPAAQRFIGSGVIRRHPRAPVLTMSSSAIRPRHIPGRPQCRTRSIGHLEWSRTRTPT